MKLQIAYRANEKTTQNELLSELLKARGIVDLESFLHPVHPDTISLKDFFEDTEKYDADLKKVFDMLTKIKKENKTIVVYTDYDADGITGGTILWETLFLLGFKVMPYVPHRKHEGYGFSKIGIDAVKEKFNPALIISVDHGISAAEKITYAKSIGIPIVVTDHHMKSQENPDDAFAIFHTSKLSGSGVSYFFSKEIFNFFKKENDKQLNDYFKYDYMSLASIGTIADLVPLVGHARSLVKYGLAAFHNCERSGIKELFDQAGIKNNEVGVYEVGFMIAPRINAIGRLTHAIDALRLLCTPNVIKAKELAKIVEGHNKNRQDLVHVAVQEARALVLKKEKQKKKIIIIASDEVSPEESHWNEGIIGLIASKLMEEFYRPIIVMTKSDGFYKGSARSIPSFNITELLKELKTYLVDFGGHTQAAGFTLQKENFSHFVDDAINIGEVKIKDEDLEKIVKIDAEIPLSCITMQFAKKLEEFQPFGIGNPQPVFKSTVKIVDAKLFGKKNEHLKIIVTNPKIEKQKIEIIAFSKAKEITHYTKDQILDITYKLDINRWNGRETIRLRLA